MGFSRKAEEMRLLYVAMTRPQEKLILTASCKEDIPGDKDRSK